MRDLQTLQLLVTSLNIIKQQQVSIEALSLGLSCDESLKTAKIETVKFSKIITSMIDPDQVESLEEELSLL